MLTVILDAGHGRNTPGKCSPIIDFLDINKKENTSIENKCFREYRFNRRIVKEVAKELKEMGFNVIEIVTEENDVSLTNRVARTNKYCKQYGSGNCIFVSEHVNAAGNGGWRGGRGWSVWTTPGQNNSDKLATCLYEAAMEHIANDSIYADTFKGEKVQKPVRGDWSDKDGDYEANFTVIKGANCPAVLIENLFQDNKEDIKYLESEHGFKQLVKTTVEGIKKYYEKYKK